MFTGFLFSVTTCMRTIILLLNLSLTDKIHLGCFSLCIACKSVLWSLWALIRLVLWGVYHTCFAFQWALLTHTQMSGRSVHLASYRLPSSSAEGPTQNAFWPLNFMAVQSSSACLSVSIFLCEILRIAHSRASVIFIFRFRVIAQLVAVCLSVPLGGAAL